MVRNTTVGIDIGTRQVKVVVAESARGKDRNFPKILGTGFAESRGLRHGYIINSSDAMRSLRSALIQAEKTSQTQIRHAFLSVGGVGLEEFRSRGEAVIGRADSEVSPLDLDRALAAAEDRIAPRILNKKILHAIPIRYRLDGSEVLGKPVGMKGGKLEVEVLYITCLEQHLNDLIQIVEELGVVVEDVMASPLAASFVTLTKAQKIAGCVLANIGAETASIAVFENNLPISIKVFPTGSTDLTNDIALGLQVSLEEAEKIKLGSIAGAAYSRKKLDDIIENRLAELFTIIESHLKKIGKSELLPAGIILTGGGTGIATIEDIARTILHLPSKIGSLQSAGEIRGTIKDSSWAVAYGLCIWGFTADRDHGGLSSIKQFSKRALGWFKQFLP